MNYKQMVEEFQCPGCVSGGNTKCGQYKPNDDPLCGGCLNHVLGTQIGLGNPVALGLPKGFCKSAVNWDTTPPERRFKMNIRLWLQGTHPGWNHLNVPVWVLEQRDGFLFVRTFCPRVDTSYVDVIEGGQRSMIPQAIDVSTFIDEIY